MNDVASDFDYDEAINDLARGTDIDPIQVKDAYRGREGLLKERHSAKETFAGICAVGLAGGAPSAVVLVADTLQAAYTHDAAKLPTTSAGILLVSAFALAVAYKAIEESWRDVKADVAKYAPASHGPG
jgi:hypothetical protein